jgi:hypothetical protein
MSSSAISQPVNNTPLLSQGGGGFVLKQPVHFRGGDVLIGFSGSAWSSTKDQLISLQLWLDGEPVPSGLLQMLASPNSSHLSLGHVWAFVPGVSAGTHTLSVMAGANTVTDQNDTVCITVWELGSNLAVHFNESVPCPEGVGQQLVKTAFSTRGQTPVMVSLSTSGWATSVGVIGATATLDQDAPAAASLEVFANNPSFRLAAVPTDVVFAPPNRGQHALQVVSEKSTSTDSRDMVHVNAVEWVDPASGPTIVQMSPPLQNTPAANQHGDGGSIASATFQSSGGTLLIRANLSAWSPSANVLITAGIQIDGTSRGFVRLFTNWQQTHLTMVSNDLVVTGIPAGRHTLNLMGELNTYTDQNDRVSVTILEF